MTWFQPTPDPPPAMTRQLARLQEAFPAYEFTLRRARGEWRFDVRRIRGSAGLYALITRDARDLWRELASQ